MLPLPDPFNLQSTVTEIVRTYRAKGFSVMAAPFGNGVMMDFRKNDEGLTKFMGLALGVSANISIDGNTMIIDFQNAEWTGKIVAFFVGWLLCFIPLITAVIGSISQIDLPKTIANDIQMVTGRGFPFSANPYANPNWQYSQARPVVKYCWKCGTSMSREARFCPGCGVENET